MIPTHFIVVLTVAGNIVNFRSFQNTVFAKMFKKKIKNYGKSHPLFFCVNCVQKIGKNRALCK